MGTRDGKEPTGIGAGIFVRTSDEDLIRWNRQRIVNALLKETDLPREVAVEISCEIQEIIATARLQHLSTSLIRELVDIKLIERGLEQQQARHCRLGMPVYDTENLLTRCGLISPGGSLGPEATNRILAESIKKDYALLSLFSDRVAVAHRRGDIHLENLGQVDRPHACLISPEYIKKFGLILPGTLANARPARHPEVLLSHLSRFSAFLQGHFSRTIAWDLINVYFAPFLSGMPEQDVMQLAQFMMYEFSQLSAARDNRPIYCDLTLYWGIPRRLRRCTAIGPGGEETGKTYGEYREEAKTFARALLETVRQGDGNGSPFFYPKLLVQLDGSFRREKGSGPFLSLAAETAVSQGNPAFLFDRGSGVQLTDIGPVSLMDRGDTEPTTTSPWSGRCHTLQTISLNLPRIAIQAGGCEETLRGGITEMLHLCATAHLEKRIFLEKLLAFGDGGSLSLLMARHDGTPLLDLERTCHLIGLCGLNEFSLAHTGRELHSGAPARRFAIDMIRFISGECEKLSRLHRIRFHASASYSEVAATRFAMKDLRYHSPRSGHVVRGDISEGSVYYTVSAGLSNRARPTPLNKATLEGEFHPHLPGGAACDLPLTGPPPDVRDAVRFIRRVFNQTLCSQLTFTPGFLYCRNCHRSFPVDEKSCSSCKTDACEKILRSGLYFTKPVPGSLNVTAGSTGGHRYRKDAFRPDKC